MKNAKARLTVTVDPELIAAANAAVRAGHASSLSAWVNDALSDRVAKEQRLRAMADAVAQYEAEFGVITAEELVAQQRADRAAAVVVRGPRRRSRGRPARRRGAA